MFYLGIEAFIAVVQTQNLSQAAKELNLAQSTVSKRLQLLEQELGIILIERGKGNKAFRLTPAGELFVDLSERWQAIYQETQNFRHNAIGLRLYIGTLLSMCDAVFPSLFSALGRHYPKLNLKVIARPQIELYNLLERLEVDVIFTTLQRANPSLIVEKFQEDPLVGLCKGTASYAQAQTIHPYDLDANNELFINSGGMYQSWHDQWWDPDRQEIIILDTPQMIPLFFSNDKQWTIIPLSYAKLLQKDGNFHIFHISEPPPSRICYKVIRKYNKASTTEALIILDQYLKMS